MPKNNILIKINDLIDDHGDNFTHCTGCNICAEIDQLRKHLNRDPVVRFNRILDKGQDMTKSDIKLLLENDIDKKTIRKALGLSLGKFTNTLEAWGLIKKREDNGMAKLEMTIDEFVQLKYVDNKSLVQIAKLKGVSDAAIHNWKNKYSVEINDALISRKTAINTTKEAQSSKTIKEDKTAEYERLINNLKAQLATKDATNVELNERIAQKVKEYEDLHASHEDVENELDEVKKYNEEIEEKLREEFDKYRIAEQDIQWLKIELDKERRNARTAQEHRDILRQALKLELAEV